MSAHVVSVNRSRGHTFSKPRVREVTLVEGLGVEGDAHSGSTVKHRSRVARDPDQPNLRQVHLVHEELFARLADAGYEVGPGDLGENVTTSGVDLLGLPVGTLVTLGGAVVTVTGLRNPCAQIDAFRRGLLKALLYRDEDGRTVRRSGVMGVVARGGVVRPGDRVDVELPPGPHHPLTTA